ncbi:hypothetical protein D3C84_463870 [compost metagenome]
MIIKVRQADIIIFPIMLLALISLALLITADESIATPVFELITIAYCLTSIKRPKKQIILISLISASYIITSYLYANLTKNINPLDFILAFKAYIYLSLLALCVNKPTFPHSRLALISKLLIAIFSVKYITSKFLLSIDRPIVFTENNYELIFLLIIYYVNFTFTKKIEPLWLALLILIFFLSGSRSSIVALALMIPFITMKRLDYKILIGTFIFTIVSIGIYYMFLERLSGNSVESIDRVRFFNFFLYEVRNWGFFDFFLGAGRLTPLTNSTCNGLSYYSTLLSFKGDGTCYSVIFHSYILRAIFDHGLILFSFLVSSIAYFLYTTGYSKPQILCILGILLITSLSVSSFNNAYVALALAIAVSAYRKEKPPLIELQENKP